MTVLKIITIPDSRLKNKSLDVCKYDKELKQKIKDLYDTLYNSENGIGLAAPQVGIFERIVVIDLKEDNKPKPLTLINPKILNKSKEKFINQEGCLSIPGYYADVERSMEIKYQWFNESGKKQTSIAQGLLSICIQHEVDHLNGVLFIDYLSGLKKKMALDKVLKFNKKNKLLKNEH